MAYLLSALQQEVDKSNEGGEPALIDASCLNQAKQAYIGLIERQARGGSLLTSLRLPRILYLWREWGEEHDVKTWVSSVLQSDAGLRRFISRFAQRMFSQAADDVVSRVTVRLNPEWLSPFLDVTQVAARVETLLQGTIADEDERLALTQFKKEYDIIKAGKDPDAPFVLDDEPE
jgi:predicted KAP-like P-loop ATPase